MLMFNPAWFCWVLTSGTCFLTRLSAAALMIRNTAMATRSSINEKPDEFVREKPHLFIFMAAPCLSGMWFG